MRECESGAKCPECDRALLENGWCVGCKMFESEIEDERRRRDESHNAQP